MTAATEGNEEIEIRNVDLTFYDSFITEVREQCQAKVFERDWVAQKCTGRVVRESRATRCEDTRLDCEIEGAKEEGGKNWSDVSNFKANREENEADIAKIECNVENVKKTTKEKEAKIVEYKKKLKSSKR